MRKEKQKKEKKNRNEDERRLHKQELKKRRIGLQYEKKTMKNAEERKENEIQISPQ